MISASLAWGRELAIYLAALDLPSMQGRLSSCSIVPATCHAWMRKSTSCGVLALRMHKVVKPDLIMDLNWSEGF